MSSTTRLAPQAGHPTAPGLDADTGRAAGIGRGRAARGVDAGRWPDVAAVPRDRGKAAIARLLLQVVVGRLKIRVQLPDGHLLRDARPGTPIMFLHRPEDFFRRVGAGGLIGFGESYMAGDWDSDDLAGLLTIMATQIDRLVPRPLQWLRSLYVARRPADWDADEQGARRNVHRHYDLSNDMFALFLDETMTYSSALFETDDFGAPLPDRGSLNRGWLNRGSLDHGSPEQAARRLAAAQRRKIDRLLDDTGVGPGTRVLEIGTGWGELAIRAAARGADVLSVTVSAEQRALAMQRVAGAGLSDRVRVELRDYREVTGQFDAIVSVEMIEAVAERYWPDYFRVLDRLLAPGGRVGLQAITMPHHRMLATRRTKTWILKYIFPGGLIPSITAIEDNVREHTGLEITRRRDFGPHYARTLQIWRDRFAAAADDLDRLGFDQVFRRMWELYLCYSEAGFRSGYLQVSQFVLARAEAAANPDGGPAAELAAAPDGGLAGGGLAGGGLPGRGLPAAGDEEPDADQDTEVAA